VTLLTIDNGVFEVLSTNGDTHLGELICVITYKWSMLTTYAALNIKT